MAIRFAGFTRGEVPVRGVVGAENPFPTCRASDLSVVLVGAPAALGAVALDQMLLVELIEGGLGVKYFFSNFKYAGPIRMTRQLASVPTVISPDIAAKPLPA